MPDTDLDTVLSRLRDDVRGALPVPAIEQVVARHKQRVIRRRMQVGAVVAVLVVSLAIPLLRDQIVPDRPDVASPPPPRSAYDTGTFVDFAEFADADHGYAIRSTCESGPRNCTSELLATEDGEHWKKRDIPRPETAPSWARPELIVLGPDEVTLDWAVSPAVETTRIARWHSVDAGVTWEKVDVPVLVTDTIAAIPENGVLAPTCARPSSDERQCEERGFVVVQPGTGRAAKLANSPSLIAMLAGRAPTADGYWWVAGRDSKTDHWALAISRDDGRTWTTSILDWGEPLYSYGWSVASHGGTLYASAIGALPAQSNGLLGIFRSTDGGRTWEQTWRPRDGKMPRQVVPTTVVADDGSLTINGQDEKQYRSLDGGRTFTEVPARYQGYAERTRTGYIASGEGGGSILVSDDGVHWRKVKIG
jgi:hypothetical protein